MRLAAGIKVDKLKILVVDDDADVGDMVGDFLTQEGFSVNIARDAAQARRCLVEQTMQIVIIDRHMPGEDGLSLARYVREHHAAGILMLTAANTVIDRIVGLEVGADDYVCKPFDLHELLARIRSVLRRASPVAAANLGVGRIRFGRCVLEVAAHKMYDDGGAEVPVTATEFDLLMAFARHPNRVLSRDDILNTLQHRDWEPSDRSIDLHIVRLRRKIEYDAQKPQVIRTIRGAGYMFAPQHSG